MPRLTPADEYFYHQIPEPLPVVANASEHWRESLFFVLHPRSGEGDALVLTLAHYPAREEMDSLQFGRIGGEAVFARHSRPYAGDPHTMAVGPVRVDIVEPFRKVRLFVDAAIAIIVKAIADFEACRGGGTDQPDARLAFEHSGTTARQCARQPEAWHVVDLPIAIVIEIVANLG